MDVNDTLIKHFQAGDTAAFAKAWKPKEARSPIMPRSWLSWLVRDGEQRRGKKPGDMFHGGIQRTGASDAEVGDFIDIVIADSPELAREGAFPAWVGFASTKAPEAKARAKRMASILDRIIPQLSRTDASKLLGAYFKDSLGQVQRKAMLEELTPHRLNGWNSKSLLRMEHLVQHVRWTLTETEEKAGIALVNATLDRLGDIPRYVRTDVVPTELIKAAQSNRLSQNHQKAITHLFFLTAHFFKPEVQQAMKNATDAPQVNLYLDHPTAEGLRALAGQNPDLSFDTARHYNSIGERTLQAYAKSLLAGDNSPQSKEWLAAIDSLSPTARDHVVSHVQTVIEELVEHRVDLMESTDPVKEAQQILPIVNALRALAPDAPLSERSWAELALTGALFNAPQSKPRSSPSKTPARR